MAEALLKVKGIKKYFKTPKGMLHAVDGVDFDMEKGETLGLVGESGCGKSTIGRVILRLLEPTEGEIYFEGQNINEFNKKQMTKLRRDMQIIFQDPFSSLNPRLSVSEIIAEPLIIHNIVGKKNSELEKEVLRLMDLVGLAKRLMNSYPHELDGGRRQRIGIARALALKPKFIVCDEPVSALDVSIQAQILNLMQDLQEDLDLTYLFITHDLSVVKHISDNIAVMYLGKVVEKAPADELFKNSLHPYTQALLSAIPVPSIKSKREHIILKGEITSPIDPKPGCRFAARCNYVMDRCFDEEPKLMAVGSGHQVACFLVEENTDN
ncbi:ABC transporter ATP-binding protein [Tepidimicrobium xylanilyticum]|uniref:Peptide/nickel transport system ATP-binding protein n=1 Tax=Tepidimicrobium xylanilyticum TaxID=1123352 RepID=A0A1H2VG20_9FIRM|nr:oligopeptide/dipeptide ABC transporter ATP-binding protein [Tepidimicrobium xylanilyticum]GMG96655.1 ABC transporter ATP-binding protein [Tepidimicrobium xylanilyticum]SDW66829.1 peptide/nickel transport system ATP-binding protein [Tepidimicrobium xylanilyticum]